MNDDKPFSLVVNGQCHSFKSGYDMWIFAMLTKPQWFLSEDLTDRSEVNSIVGQYGKKRTK